MSEREQKRSASPFLVFGSIKNYENYLDAQLAKLYQAQLGK
jgi:hypothetical protein